MRLILLLSLLIPLVGSAQNKSSKSFTKQLCSPEFHGRGYVNGGDSLAADFIAETFKQIGLQPFQGNYFQPFSFSVNTFPGEMRLTVDSKELVPGVHYLADPSSGGGVYSGEILHLSFDDLFHNKITSKKIKNGTILAWKNRGYRGDTLKVITEKLNTVRSFGPLIEIVSTKLTWSVSQEGRKFPYFQVHDSVFKESSNFASLSLDAKTIRHTARNVIGFLPAKSKSNKTILISAHYDHLGRMGRETYFPGANDNASGNAMLIELAEKFVSSPLKKYNLLFVAFAGEEAGLLGSQYMVKNPIINLENIRFMLNLDIMGSGEEGITVVNSTLFDKEFKKLIKLNKRLKALPIIKPRGPAANSDHYFFTQAGVPAFFIYTMGPNKHYHDIFDTYDELSFSAFNSLANLFECFVRKL